MTASRETAPWEPPKYNKHEIRQWYGTEYSFFKFYYIFPKPRYNTEIADNCGYREDPKRFYMQSFLVTGRCNFCKTRKKKMNQESRKREGWNSTVAKSQHGTCVLGPERPVQIEWEKIGLKERTMAKELKTNLLGWTICKNNAAYSTDLSERLEKRVTGIHKYKAN